jgi:hypothetical protein
MLVANCQPTLRNSQTSCGAHPTSYSVGTGGSFLGAKRPGREANHWPPRSAEIKNEWSTMSSTHRDGRKLEKQREFWWEKLPTYHPQTRHSSRFEACHILQAARSQLVGKHKTFDFFSGLPLWESVCPSFKLLW